MVPNENIEGKARDKVTAHIHPSQTQIQTTMTSVT